MNDNFWSGRKVFITGHTGFKGAWLSLWLQELGAELMGYSLPAPTTPSLYEAALVGKGMLSVISDIRDAASLDNAVRSFSPEIIFHLAAQSLVIKSYENPVETYSTNVMGTINLFEAAKKISSIKVIVNVTSDKCYENKEWDWGYRECDPVGGDDPYSSSKGCAELITTAYRNSFFRECGIGLASARAGNVIGGGDWAENRLFPDIFRAFANFQPLEIRNPFSVRPWQHVLEPLAGYLKLAEFLYSNPDRYGESWNFGPNDSDTKTVGWMIEKIAEKLGYQFNVDISKNQSFHEANLLKLDCSKSRAHLEWFPKWDVEQAIEHIIEWNKQYSLGHNPRSVSINQIKKYMET